MNVISVETVFADYLVDLAKDHDVREEVRLQLRELDQTSRELIALLQKVHLSVGVANMPAILAQSKSLFATKVRPQLSLLTTLIPATQYYRFHPMYNFTIQRLCFATALGHYFEKETAITRDEVAKDLGIKVNPKDGFHLDLEDYLAGLILTSNELSRFCVNSVTHGDYQRPLRISAFLNDLLNAFRLLNLKNDNLRKKFDSLKYDLKKVEEVVYDLSIRGLTKGEESKQEENLVEAKTEDKISKAKDPKKEEKVFEVKPKDPKKEEKVLEAKPKDFKKEEKVLEFKPKDSKKDEKVLETKTEDKITKTKDPKKDEKMVGPKGGAKGEDVSGGGKEEDTAQKPKEAKGGEKKTKKPSK